MITLITGAPGAGKTSALVGLLRELAKGRPIFVDGIPDLKIDHVPMADARTWPDSVPDGAVVVIDEVQRVWRPAGAGAKVPPDISGLETHRHRGLDFYIITQHPKLVHANVRALVGRHVHLRDIGVLGRWWYEWPETASTPETSWRTAPVKKKYRIDKKTFGLYKSASEHIKPIRSIPPVLIVFFVALFVLAGLAWFIYRFIERANSGAASASAVAPSASAPASGSAWSASRPSPGPHAVTASQLVASFSPRVAHWPESAPAYDHLRVVRVMPRVVAGFCEVGGACRCWTQQGTDPGIGPDACRDFVERPPFDPYREAPPSVASSPAAPASAGTDYYGTADAL